MMLLSLYFIQIYGPCKELRFILFGFSSILGRCLFEHDPDAWVAALGTELGEDHTDAKQCREYKHRQEDWVHIFHGKLLPREMKIINGCRNGES